MSHGNAGDTTTNDDYVLSLHVLSAKIYENVAMIGDAMLRRCNGFIITECVHIIYENEEDKTGESIKKQVLVERRRLEFVIRL